MRYRTFSQRISDLCSEQLKITKAPMFDRERFLESVLSKAGSKAAIGRALGLPSSRVAELYRENGAKRQRALTMEEGMRLAEEFGVWPCSRVSAERLIPVLR